MDSSGQGDLLVGCSFTRFLSVFLKNLISKLGEFVPNPGRLKVFFQAKKNPGSGSSLGLGLSAWRFPTFARQPVALSSALSGFTSEFGMGSGGSRSLWSPSKRVRLTMRVNLRRGSRPALEICNSRFSRFKASAVPEGVFFSPPKPIGCYMVKPHGQLVHVSCTHYWASTPCLSTWWSPRAL